MRRQLKDKIQTNAPTRIINAGIRDKVDVDGTVQNDHKKRSVIRVHR